VMTRLNSARSAPFLVMSHDLMQYHHHLSYGGNYLLNTV
jgi:hypothetical protein